MQIIPVSEDYDQITSFIGAGRRVTIRLRYSPSNRRWSFDLARDDEPIVHGRRLVFGCDVLGVFKFGIGGLFLYSERDGLEPNYENVTSGSIQLVHLEPEELP